MRDSVSPLRTWWIRKVSRSEAGMRARAATTVSLVPFGTFSRYGRAADAGGVHQRRSSGLSSWMRSVGGPRGAGEHVEVGRFHHRHLVGLERLLELELVVAEAERLRVLRHQRAGDQLGDVVLRLLGEAPCRR